MKIVETLQAVLSKMEEREILQFRAYASYKDEKKLLKFFDLIHKYIDKELDAQYLLLFLKSKRVKNFNVKCTDLFQLLLRFWRDNPPKGSLQLQLSQLMFSAGLLIRKGLLKQGLNLYKKAGLLSENGEMFSYQYEIFRVSLYWSSHLNPRNIDSSIKKNQEKKALVEKKMEMLFDAKVLNTKLQSYLFNEKEWNKKFTKKKIEQVSVLLEDKDCPIRAKNIYHNILSNTYSSYQVGNWELVDFHKKELIRGAEILHKTDPDCLPLISSIANLLCAYFSLKKNPEFQQYLIKFRKLVKNNVRRDKNIESLHHEIELKYCNLTKNYADANQFFIPNAVKFINHYEKKNTIKSFWSIFSLCFEHYFSTGHYEKSVVFLSRMKQENKQYKLNPIEIVTTNLYEILYHFELKNYELARKVLEEATQLYHISSNENKGIRIMLNYLLQLIQTIDEPSKIPIYCNFKNDLEKTLKNYAFAKDVRVNNIVDWIDTKINKFNTIQAYVDARTVNV